MRRVVKTNRGETWMDGYQRYGNKEKIGNSYTRQVHRVKKKILLFILNFNT